MAADSGCEMTFAVNHLGHFYLTALLIEELRETAAKLGSARVRLGICTRVRAAS